MMKNLFTEFINIIRIVFLTIHKCTQKENQTTSNKKHQQPLTTPPKNSSTMQTQNWHLKILQILVVNIQNQIKLINVQNPDTNKAKK